MYFDDLADLNWFNLLRMGMLTSIYMHLPEKNCQITNQFNSSMQLS